ncbi:MAG TPA: CHASE2 domain-containing protein, partial [Syntrophales bacterium]|nr:CHASE2 domain-containing protein [Syntrophales bacterium]
MTDRLDYRSDVTDMRLTTPQSRRDRIIAGLILAALSWAVLLILYFGNFLESYELRTYDQLCRFDARDAGKPRDTVLVAVDQGSLEAAGGQGINWPWPRQMYAPIV